MIDTTPAPQQALADLLGGTPTGPSTIATPAGTVRCYPSGAVWLLRTDAEPTRLGSWRETQALAEAYRAVTR